MRPCSISVFSGPSCAPPESPRAVCMRDFLAGMKPSEANMQGVSLPGSQDQYKYTMAYFFPPSGKEIHKVGVSPDIETEFPDLSDEELERFVEFLKSDALDKWKEEHPEYTKENVIAFADYYEDTGFPRIYLLLRMRDRYEIDMPYSELPVADLWFDVTLLKAIDYLTAKTGAK